MQLRFSPTSPYARKVRVFLIETGLDKSVTMVPTNPWSAETDLGRDNPLGRVPVLIDDEGHRIFDSPVICEYLDGMHGGARLFPAEGKARLMALMRQALGDGILDAAIAHRIEIGMRPEAARWQWWIDRQKVAVARGLAQAESEAAALTDFATVGDIAIACALGYLDFRFAADDWRTRHPHLARWFERQQKRPSMVATAPRE